MLDPDLLCGWKIVGTVERCRCHVNLVLARSMLIGERCAAVATECAHDRRRRTVTVWFPRHNRELAGRKNCPGDGRSTTRQATTVAMAKRSGQRLTRDSIANRATQTPALNSSTRHSVFPETVQPSKGSSSCHLTPELRGGPEPQAEGRPLERLVMRPDLGTQPAHWQTGLSLNEHGRLRRQAPGGHATLPG